MSDLNALEQVREDDRKFFNQHPDREYRLRRAQTCEYVGEVTDDQRVFGIVHRDEVACEWQHFYFKAPTHFRTTMSDYEIADFLRQAAA